MPYLKKIKIKGFRTYANCVDMEDFGRGVNLVVGMNGSGKTNLLNAILFVLSDTYVNLKDEEKSALLFEGPSKAMQEANVEIVFDNSDNSMGGQKGDVSVKRVLTKKSSSKKATYTDVYSVNGKQKSRQEVKNFLALCGMQVGNPYYVVRQGKITEMAHQKDAGRLRLIEEVSGCALFDRQIKKAEKAKQQMAHTKGELDEAITDAKDRLEQLLEQQSDLDKWKSAADRLKFIEYVVAERQVTSANDKLKDIDQQKVSLTEQKKNVQATVSDADLLVEDLDHQLITTSDKHATLAAQERELFNAIKKSDEPIAAVKCELAEVEQDKTKAREELDKCSSKLLALQQEQKELNDQVTMKKPKYDKLGNQLRELKHSLALFEEERAHLLSKQACKDKFSTVKERNLFLQGEHDKSKQHYNRKMIHKKDLTKELENMKKNLKSSQKEVSSYSSQRSLLNQKMKDSSDLSANCTAHLTTLSEGLRAKLASRQELHSEIHAVDKEKQWALERVQKTMRYDHKRGNDACFQYAQEHASTWGSGVKGTLLEHLKVPEEFRLAAEIVANTQLFNILCVDDDIAAKLVKHVRVNKYGSVAVTPLSRLATQSRPKYPPNLEENGFKPLIDVLKYPKWAAPAVYQVFGRYIVVPDLASAHNICVSHKLSAITLEGDQSDVKGAMKGGFVDPNKYVRLKNYAKSVQCGEKMTDMQNRLTSKDQEIASSRQKQQKVHDERAIHDRERESLQHKVKLLHQKFEDEKRTAEVSRNRIKDIESVLANTDNDIAMLHKKLQSFKEEMAGTKLENLEASEQTRLGELSGLVRMQTTKVDNAVRQYYAVGNDTKSCEARLKGFVEPQICKYEGDRAKTDERLRGLQDTQKVLNDRLAALQTNQSDKENLFKHCQESIVACNNEKDRLRKLLTRTQAKRTKADNMLQEIMTTVDSFGRQTADCLRVRSMAQSQIRSFTSIPQEEKIQEFVNLPHSDLDRELKKAQDTVVSFKNVNKKAFDQFDVYQYDVSRLSQEVQRLEDCEKMLDEQLDGYMEKRARIVEITAKVVNKFFKYIFSRLVPGGNAALTVVKQNGTVVGVRPHLSFKGQKMRTSQELSGGQKTVMALSLIFALQRADTAPFYIFDEIDAALDVHTRRALAEMLRMEAYYGRQIIITSFRPELLTVAEKIFKVYMHARASFVNRVTVAEAEDIIKEQRAEVQGHLEDENKNPNFKTPQKVILDATGQFAVPQEPPSRERYSSPLRRRQALFTPSGSSTGQSKSQSIADRSKDDTPSTDQNVGSIIPKKGGRGHAQKRSLKDSFDDVVRAQD